MAEQPEQLKNMIRAARAARSLAGSQETEPAAGPPPTLDVDRDDRHALLLRLEVPRFAMSVPESNTIGVLELNTTQTKKQDFCKTYAANAGRQYNKQGFGGPVRILSQACLSRPRHNPVSAKARQGKAGQGKAGQEKAGQGKARACGACSYSSRNRAVAGKGAGETAANKC